MKKVCLAIALSFLCIPAFSQNTEISLALNTGLFSFRGSRVASASFINYNPKINSYTNNPYGSLLSPVFGIAFGLKKITPYHLVFGFGFGYDFLKSRIKIIDVYTGGKMMPAVGNTHINQNFVNLFPQLGYRFQVKKISIDMLLGFDVGFGLKFTERGYATTENGERYTTVLDRGQTADFRPRVQLGIHYKSFGGFLSYADGLIPYDLGEMGVRQMGIYADLWRLGFVYTFQKKHKK